MANEQDQTRDVVIIGDTGRPSQPETTAAGGGDDIIRLTPNAPRDRTAEFGQYYQTVLAPNVGQVVTTRYNANGEPMPGFPLTTAPARDPSLPEATFQIERSIRVSDNGQLHIHDVVRRLDGTIVANVNYGLPPEGAINAASMNTDVIPQDLRLTGGYLSGPGARAQQQGFGALDVLRNTRVGPDSVSVDIGGIFADQRDGGRGGR